MVTDLSTSLASFLIPQGVDCTLKIAEAPAIHGIRLRMKIEDVLALFPGSKEDPELLSTLAKPPGRFGNSTFVIAPSKYRNTQDFKRISRITFSVLDGRVSNFTVSYNGPQWPDVNQFIDNLIEGKNLPASGQWETHEGVDQMKTLTCNGFSIRVFAGGEGGSLNYVLVEDREADATLKDRRKKAREQPGP